MAEELIREEAEKRGNFIDEFIKEDLAEGGRCEGMRVHQGEQPPAGLYIRLKIDDVVIREPDRLRADRRRNTADGTVIFY